MNLSFKKMMVPTASAVVGGIAVLAVLKLNPALQSKLIGNADNAQKNEASYDDIFDQEDPFKHMIRMREQMEKRLGDFAGKSPKFGSDNDYDISTREDDGFVYYDIKINDLNSTSIDTKVENGYVTISGTVEKKDETGRDNKNDKFSSQYIYKSTFNRTFPIPDNVNADKMQMTPEKDKVVLKFPKLSA